MSPSTVGLSTLLLTALFLGEAEPASAQQAARLTEADVYHEYGYVKVRDGVRLAYALWLPKKEGRYPTLFTYDSYGAGGLTFPRVKPYLEAGYAVLGANARGSGCSEGTYSFLGPKEGPDGAVVVEWAAAQPWSTGSIGMFGCSNGGASQVAVAAQRPPHLKAITPYVMPASLYREFAATTGGMPHLGAAADWTFNIQPVAVRQGAEARLKCGDPVCAAIRAKQPAVTSFYHDVLAHPLQDQWWEDRALENVAGRVEVPALFMQSWQDAWDMPDGGLRVFQLAKSTHKRLIVQNGAHCGTSGPANPALMRWLDRWVKGEANGVENEPPVVIGWEQGGRGAAGWTTTYPSWPVPNLQRVPFYLTADGKLGRKQAGTNGTQGVRSYLYPMGTELVGDNAQFALAPLSLGFSMGPRMTGSLNYQTDPMNQDLVLLGAPILTFYFSSEQTDTDFMFTLKDIDPEGNTLFLQRAYLRASLRAIDSARSSRDYIAHAFRKYDKLVPGKVYEIKLSVGALGHVVRQGHRLELSILAPNPIPGPVMGSAPLGGPSVNTVYHSSQYPSTLVLPVVPGEKARAPAPECGSLPGQPCRPPAPAPGHAQQSSTSRTAR